MSAHWGQRVFYGWWIVAAGFGVEALIGALMFHAYGAYVVLLREEFGWSKTMLSAAFSMARAESGIRAGVASLRLPREDMPPWPLTVSIGVAALPDHGTSSAALLMAADTALYRAKREGRNRVEVAARGEASLLDAGP